MKTSDEVQSEILKLAAREHAAEVTRHLLYRVPHLRGVYEAAIRAELDRRLGPGLARYFEDAAAHAERILRRGWLAPRRDHCTPAQELADRALTRAMVRRGKMALRPGDGARARQIIEDAGWGYAAQYRNDVPGRLNTFARMAKERGW